MSLIAQYVNMTSGSGKSKMSIFRKLHFMQVFHAAWRIFYMLSRTLRLVHYSTRGFSFARLLAFTKSLAWLVCRVEKPLQQDACGFRWACSWDASKLLEVDTWLTGFKTGFNQLNNSRALVLDRWLCKPEPAWHFLLRLAFQQSV